MKDAFFFKIWGELFVHTAIIGLKNFDFVIEKILNFEFKDDKHRESIGFVCKRIDPSVMRVNIHK